MITELSEDSGPESDEAGCPVSSSHLLALSDQPLRVLPQSGARGEEGLEAEKRSVSYITTFTSWEFLLTCSLRCGDDRQCWSLSSAGVESR